MSQRFKGLRNKAARGFTLVEMALVLVVIGLILGAVSIGKDIQRNAEYAKIKQKFVDQWASAYNSYFVRAGVVLGDSQTAPNYMVNGVDFAPTTPGTSGSNGTMVGVTGPAAICDSTTAPPNSPITNPVAKLYDEMDRMGVRMPPGRAEGKEARYVYLDSNGNPQEIQICFQWNSPTTASNSGNVMVISGLTPDLARALDQMIDGKADAQEGMFRQAGVLNGTAGSAGIEWGTNNTVRLGVTGSATSGATSTGTPVSAAVTVTERKDEDQVITVTAHYKMNQ